MKVWIVVCHQFNYDSCSDVEVVGIFTTRNKALYAKRKYLNKNKQYFEGHDVFIEEKEVDKYYEDG